MEDLTKAILRSSTKESDRMLRAEEEYGKGNIAVAYRLYVGVASSHPATEYSSTARERLENIRQKGKQQCEEIDTRLNDLVQRMNIVSDKNAEPIDPSDEIERIFQDYKQLLKQFQQVSPFGSWLMKHVTQQHNRPECAAVLNEPKAAELWKLGQIHEENDQLCCAYRAYEKAEKFLPAPSAKLAQSKLKTMKENPKIVEAAKTCAELEWCHRTYQRAEKILEKNPERAQELFSQIVERSPSDSTVHRAAQDRLEEQK